MKFPAGDAGRLCDEDQWLQLVNLQHKFKNSKNKSVPNFRRLLVDTEKVIVVTPAADNNINGGSVVKATVTAIDAAPTNKQYDSLRVLLNDRVCF